jgi:hypothetical protein
MRKNRIFDDFKRVVFRGKRMAIVGGDCRIQFDGSRRDISLIFMSSLHSIHPLKSKA